MAAEHKRTEKTLLQSENYFKAQFNNAPLSYQSLDENGRLIDVNTAWLDSLGYSRDEVLGRWFGDFVAPDYVNNFRKIFPRFINHGHVSGVEMELIRRCY